MESLYRKYRPQTFDDVVGQQHIVSTLKNAVAEGRLSHAYLFCGPRGTGKTTMARILAKSLLCAHPHDHMPCGTCAECVEIAQGAHPDVFELDAASRTGVDNVREEIINSVSFAPVRGGYKIYIIDEVHMLTTAAFNALLKTLEEPPEHVVFVLATTDPQKVPETILSRCQRFDFHRIGMEDIERRLAYVCESERFATEPEALALVAKHARGGMRDALSILEQLSVFGNGSVRLSDAQSLLGEVASSVLAEFAAAVARRDVVALFRQISSQVEEGNDLLELTRDLVAHIRDVYMVRVAGAVPELFENGTPEELDALAREAELFEDADRLSRVLMVLDDAAIEMRTASDPRLVLEVACTRLARPESDLTLEALAERVSKLEHQLAAGTFPVQRATAHEGAAAPSAASAPASPRLPSDAKPARSAQAGVPWARPQANAPAAEPVKPAAPTLTMSSAAEQHREPAEARPASPEPAVRASEPAVPSSEPAAPAPEPVALAPEPAAPEPSHTESAQPEPAPVAADQGALQRKWKQAVKAIVAAQPSRGALLQSARALSDDGEKLVIGFPAGSNFAIKMLGRADSQALIPPIVAQVFGPRVLEYTMGKAESAAARPAAPKPVPQIDVPGFTGNTENRETPVATPDKPSEAAEHAQEAPESGQAGTTHADAGAPERGASAEQPAPSAPEAPSAQVGAAPASVQAAPEADQSSAPTPMPAAPSDDGPGSVWEDDAVPYDDAEIAALTGEDAPAAPAPAPAAPAPRTAGGLPWNAPGNPGAGVAPTVPSSSSAPAPAYDLPWEAPAASAGASAQSTAQAAPEVPAARPWEKAAAPSAAPAPASAPPPSAPAEPAEHARPDITAANPFAAFTPTESAPADASEIAAVLGNVWGGDVVLHEGEEPKEPANG